MGISRGKWELLGGNGSYWEEMGVSERHKAHSIIHTVIVLRVSLLCLPIGLRQEVLKHVYFSENIHKKMHDFYVIVGMSAPRNVLAPGNGHTTCSQPAKTYLH